VFDEIENTLADDLVLLQSNDEGKRTFFDNSTKEEEKGDSIQLRDSLPINKSLNLNPDLNLSSLDLVTYAYLKEIVVNTSDSEESKLLTAKAYPKLMHFLEVMDFLFKDKNKQALQANKVQLK
jgi:hypothetical protein